MKKRGYFFTLDVLIALIIIVVGFMMVWSSLSARALVTQPYFLSQDIIDFLQSTKNKDVSSILYANTLQPDGSSMLSDGNITDYEMTLLEQIALFYNEYITQPEGEDKKPDHVLRNYTRIILANATPIAYSFEFLLDDHVLYSQQGISGRSQDDSDSLVSSKTIVSVIIDKTTLSPSYVAEVRVWQ